jgi:NADPH:quinone reductase-like Zn-dependent oxidoreductase
VPPEHDAHILVWGGSSSVGHFALPLLNGAGYANVTAPVLRKELGAIQVFDYRKCACHRNLSESGEYKYMIDTIGSVSDTLTHGCLSTTRAQNLQ